MSTGLQEKQLGLYRVESHNRALVKLARAIARELCCKYGSVTIDMIRTDPRMAEFAPSSPNFWGCLFMGDEWHCLGYEPSQLKTNHHRRVGRWAYRLREGR